MQIKKKTGEKKQKQKKNPHLILLSARPSVSAEGLHLRPPLALTAALTRGGIPRMLDRVQDDGGRRWEGTGEIT